MPSAHDLLSLVLRLMDVRYVHKQGYNDINMTALSPRWRTPPSVCTPRSAEVSSPSASCVLRKSEEVCPTAWTRQPLEAAEVFFTAAPKARFSQISVDATAGSKGCAQVLEMSPPFGYLSNLADWQANFVHRQSMAPRFVCHLLAPITHEWDSLPVMSTSLASLVFLRQVQLPVVNPAVVA